MKHGLEIRLLNYFLLITIAAMMIGVEFFFEMNRVDLTREICQASSDPSVSEPLQHLRNKIVIMFGVLTLVVAIVLMMFIKNITWPLQHMVDVAERINSGDLSQSVEIKTQDELGQLGTAINDLTSNLQEIAVFSAATSDAIQQHLQALSSRLDSPEALEEIQAIRSELQSLREFISLFEVRRDQTS